MGTNPEGRATALRFVPVTWVFETPTLRDRRRWSYAPCGLLLALALKRPYTVGTMMSHGRRSPFHRLQPDVGRRDHEPPRLKPGADGRYA